MICYRDFYPPSRMEIAISKGVDRWNCDDRIPPPLSGTTLLANAGEANKKFSTAVDKAGCDANIPNPRVTLRLKQRVHAMLAANNRSRRFGRATVLLFGN